MGNRLIAVDGGAASYQYDASGRRVRKVVGGSATEYVLDLEGRVVQEYGPSLNLVRTELFAGGQHLGTYRDGATYFSHADWLGTERARTNMVGAVVETFTSLPFGDALSSPGGVSPLHFTGKERDAESGLDYFGARYYGSNMGRFTSPDPLLNSGRPDNPQSWNRYSYTFNNPLKFIDPTEMYNLVNNCASDNKKCNKKFEQNAKKLKQGLSDLQKKVDEMKDGTEKTRLQNALKSMGTENDGNNINVRFGALAGTAAGNTETVADEKGNLSFNVTFDASKITAGTNDWAIDAAHEGTHVNDISNPLFANEATTLSPFQQEYRGYQTSAWAAQVLGLPSLSFGSFAIWNSSWAAVDQQTLMDRGITQHVTSIPGHPDTKPDQHNPWPN